MEIIEIKSPSSLITSITDNRPPEAHTYKVNCRQYLSAFTRWQRQGTSGAGALGVMTLDFEHIWITETEGKQIAAAIQAANSPVIID